MKVCALTGAHGYVGSALRRGLTAAGWTVVSLSRREKLAEDEIRWSLDQASASQPNALGEELADDRANLPPGFRLLCSRDVEQIFSRTLPAEFDRKAA